MSSLQRFCRRPFALILLKSARRLHPGGLNNNRDFAECLVSYGESVPAEIRTILFDPQTAGGLLLSVARADTAALLDALKSAGVPAVEIGEVLPPGKPLIQVV